MQEALQQQLLSGTATYQLPHHPRYAHVFSGRLHRAIWLQAQLPQDSTGRQRFTRVMSGRPASAPPGRGAQRHSSLTVAPEVLHKYTDKDLERNLRGVHLSQLPMDLAMGEYTNAMSPELYDTGMLF